MRPPSLMSLRRVLLSFGVSFFLLGLLFAQQMYEAVWLPVATVPVSADSWYWIAAVLGTALVLSLWVSAILAIREGASTGRSRRIR